MWKRKRIQLTDGLFFVTANFSRREKLFFNVHLKDLMLQVMKMQREKYGFRIYEYVLMPDHHHVIVAPKEHQTVGQVMQYVHGMFAKHCNQLLHRTGRVFQREYYDHVIRDLEDYRIKARYIHNNPVRAELVNTAEEYEWSSASERITGKKNQLPVDSLEW